jgi:biopolymer transport protein ExbB/biopolymer transport protein TolQ
MIERMGWPARIVAVALAIMSIYSIGVMFERWLTFNAARNQSRQFVAQVASALRSNQIDEAITVSEKHRKSHLAIVVNAGLQEYLVQREEGGEIAAIADATRDSIERAKAIKTAELSRGLSGLATIGSTAPFVGLLGTVIGIINAFQGMRVSEGTALESVSGGISEALVETAFGLMVAIPAVWTFNHFNSRLEAFRVEMNNSASELMMYVKKHSRRQDRLTGS